MSDISSRKGDHLDLTISGDVGFKKTTTLLECVRLVHQALPEIDVREVDLSTRMLGKRLSAPIVIAGMTGGTDRASDINRELASIAEEHGYAFGLGSQRAMLKKPGTADTYRIRDVAPTALVLGNVGVVQATSMSTAQVAGLASSVGADALCIHMNPAMEIIQSEGDRDFRGGLETFTRLASELDIPIIAKETGCGVSTAVAKRLVAAGVRHVDVSGAGGTSWVGVETRRASPDRERLGERFWEWGIPTAASVAFASSAGFRTVLATGGIQDGLDVAKAIALGASAAGFARPVLQALDAGGRDGAVSLLKQVELELRAAMLLTGSKTVTDLARAQRIVHGELGDWIRQGAEA